MHITLRMKEHQIVDKVRPPMMLARKHLSATPVAYHEYIAHSTSFNILYPACGRENADWLQYTIFEPIRP